MRKEFCAKKIEHAVFYVHIFFDFNYKNFKYCLVASSETNNEKLQEAVKEDGAEVSSIAVSTIDFASASASGDVVEYQTEPNEFDPIESTEDGNMVENPNGTLALTLEGSNNLFSTPKNVPFAIRGRRRSTNDKPSRSIALQRVREILKSFTPSQNVAPNAAAQQVTKRPLPDLIPINKNEFLRRHSVYVENFEGDEDDSSDEEEKEDLLSFIQRKKKELKPLISRK